MIRKLTTKKDLILDAALRLVAKKNAFNVTIREISTEANVNVAAINYYFNSKEQLFKEMEKLFTDNFVDAFIPLDDPSLNDEQKLIAWLMKAISYAVHYPGILVLLKDKFTDENSNEKDVEMKLALINRIFDIKKLFEKVSEAPEDEADKLFIAFGASVIVPFIANNYFDGLGLVMNEDEQLEYIKLILNKFKKVR